MQLFGWPADIDASQRIGERLRGVLFDIDRTLYDNDEYAHGQITALIARFARQFDEDPANAHRRIKEWQRTWSETNAGARQSLGNTFASLGVPIETSVRWREAIIEPEKHLQRDPRLRRAIEFIRTRGGRADAPRLPLVVVTNNPVTTGRRSLAALGVDDLFDEVIGLDTTMRSKPDAAPFRAALDRVGCDAESVVCVGDRYDVDIAPALALGIGGVLVDGVTDVYELPALFGYGAPGNQSDHGDRPAGATGA
ncbi:MAG: HAD family hydrolase [Spirochaetaceae bacterium]|nr:MAG: HAD family hydrolase [Spirochaetaceae bacterium]